MAKEVTRLVQDWLDDEFVKWEATTEVVDWARAYGTDLERAWAECPRADFLMAIAGACQAEPERLVGAACSAAREALAFVPAKLGLPRKAVHRAESIRPGSPELPDAPTLLERAMALVDKLVIEGGRLRKAAKAARPDATQALARAAMSFLRDQATHEHLAGAQDSATPGQIPQEAVASTVAMLEGMLKEKAVVCLRDRTAALHRLLASAHAARAAASSLTVATSRDVEVKCLVLIERKLQDGRATDETFVAIDKAATIARRSGARVYSEAALVFEHAAGAFGRIVAADERAWRGAITSLITSMFHAAGGAELDPEDQGMFHATLEAHAEHAKLAKLAEYADRVRAVIPFSALRPPEDEADRAAAMQRDPRGALLRAVTSLAPIVRILGNREAADAVETAGAILRATGPVNKKALATVLRTIHERLAAMFRERAREVAGASHEDTRAAAISAEEAMREIDATLAALDVGEPN